MFVPNAADLIEAEILKLRELAQSYSKAMTARDRDLYRLEVENGKLLDQIEELKKEIRTRDLMIEELRGLVGGAR